MNKSSYRSATAEPTRLPGCPLAGWMLLALLITFPANAGAAEFDERLSAPTDLSAAELKEKVRVYFEALEDGSLTMLDTLMNPVLYTQWQVDLWWHVYRAGEQRGSLEDLAEYGITPREEGSYSIDFDRFPQWANLATMIAMRFGDGLHPQTEEVLRQKGFDDSDINALRQYVETRPSTLRQELLTQENRPLTVSFTERVQRRTPPGQRIDRANLMAFRYQLHRNLKEASRTWAVGLMSSLDPQLQEILSSVAMEPPRGGMGFAPNNDLEADLKSMEDALLSGEYVRAIQTEQTEVRQ